MPLEVSASTTVPPSAPGAAACTGWTATGFESWSAGGAIERLTAAGAGTAVAGRSTAGAGSGAPGEVDGAVPRSHHTRAIARGKTKSAIQRRCTDAILSRSLRPRNCWRCHSWRQ
jgi:hypothetical protein